MVSTRGVRYKFSEGERVLCYEPDPTKAKVLYDSKVLEVIESKDKRGRRTMEYLIHFQGWNSSWDRCVSEDFVLKDTEENRQLQRDLAEKSQLQLGAYLYRRERKKGSSASAGAGPAKRPRHGFSDDGSSTSTQPDEGETAGDTDSSAGSRGSQPSPPPLPQPGRAQITLPPTLRDLLTFDYHLVVKRGRLSALPASPSAADILESFVKWFARSGAWRQRARPDPPHRPDLADVCCRLNLVREVADGLRVYFDFIVRGHLLYKQEAAQYDELCGKFEPKEEDPASASEENHKEEVDPSIAELDIKSPKIPEYAHLPPDPTDVADNHEGSQSNEKPVINTETDDTNETNQHKLTEVKATKDETPKEKTPNDIAHKEKISNDKPPKDKTNKKSSCEKVPNDRIPNDKFVREKPPNDKCVKENLMNDETLNKVVKDKPNDKAAKDKTPSDRAAKENATKVKTHSEKTAKEKPTSDKLNNKTANDKTPSEKTLRDKTVNDKTPTDKSSNDKLAATDKNIPEDANHVGAMTPRESRCATRSENLARRLRSHKSVAPETEGEPVASSSALKPASSPGPSSAVAASTSASAAVSAAAIAAAAVLPGEPRIFETLSSSVCSSESSVSSGWAARRAAAAAPVALASQLTRTPLSVLLDKVAKWQIIPREGTENLPCRVYGAIHLARLFVKLPDFLNATQIPDIKLKLILKHIDMFVQYLEEHNEWFGEMYYIADTASRSR